MADNNRVVQHVDELHVHAALLKVPQDFMHKSLLLAPALQFVCLTVFQCISINPFEGIQDL